MCKAKVRILEAVQEMAYPNVLLKMGFLQVSCHHLKKRLDLVNQSSSLIKKQISSSALSKK